MTILSLTHIIFLIITILVITLLIIITRRVNPKTQNIIFIIITILGSLGIFYRHAMNLSFKEGINITALLIQLLQVCNFNFILLPLMLIPKLELARQYSVFFSMFAAMSTFIDVPLEFRDYNWYDPVIINSWLNHLCSVLLPILMIASRRLKPNKKYVFKVTITVIVYFTMVYVISELLKQQSIIPQDKNYSFVYHGKGIPVLDISYKLIPIAYLYLYPILPFMMGFFYILSKIFDNYHVNKYEYH